MDASIKANPVSQERMPLGRRIALWVFRFAALIAGLAIFFPPKYTSLGML